MGDIPLDRMILFGLCVFINNVKASVNAIPKFTVVSAKSFLEPPSIKVVFPNGFRDDLILEPYKLFKQSDGGNNYLGYLKNTPGSSAAVTGNLGRPGDRMEITLFSKHNKDQMFEIDSFGETKVIHTPITNKKKKGHPVSKNRNKRNNLEGSFQVEVRDDKIDTNRQRKLYSKGIESMPPKLKMVIKLGYTEGLVQELAKYEYLPFPKYIEKVMVHAQARFNDPSLGTKIQLEVQDGFLYTSNLTWCAANSLWYAWKASVQSNLQDIDVTAWFTTSCTWSPYRGHSYIGKLCTSDAVTINDVHGSYASTGFTVAHEIGHVLGMSHDSHSSHGGNDSPCYLFEQGTMEDDYTKTGWSSCSKHDFEYAYDTKLWGNGCLEDISHACTKDTCKNGGTCNEVEGGGFTCSCFPGITGNRCENNPNLRCKGKDACCTSQGKCKEWDGACGKDSDCVEGLICGNANCPRKYGYDWNLGDNCCFKPDLKIKTTCKSIAIDGNGKSGNCVFPFYYEGIKYSNCAKPDGNKGVGFCSFNSVYKDGEWGYCTSECPASTTCEATSLENPPIYSGSVKNSVGFNGECVFPFKHNKQIFYNCADPKYYAGVGWCSFKSDGSGQWGYCTSKCPATYNNPCDAIVCNVPGEACENGICKCGSARSCEGSLSGSFCDVANSKCKCSAKEDVIETN